MSQRDQEASPFAEHLSELCRLSGAVAAALVDQEGETVDYAGRLLPFDVRVLAAEWRLVQQHMASAPVLSQCSEFTVRAVKKSFHLSSLAEGYSLVVELPKRATRLSERALSHAIRRISQEAGFHLPRRPNSHWEAVEVTEAATHSQRPEQMDWNGESVHLDVLGRLESKTLRDNEHGYRIRLGNGHEGTLVREPLARWYFELELWP
ncbi:MAG: hypothetical protein MK135_00565 [Polyangiaceae bacterium]|nr:hypothetical protein [Polyangiaceae bacterium]